MNHVSAKWIRWLRRLFLVYCGHFVISYLYIGLRYHEWGGTKTFPIVIIYFVAIQAIYELVISLKYIKKYAYLATYITITFLLIENAIVLNPSGIYYSPYMITVLVMIFLAGALGWLLASLEVVIMAVFYLFGLAGFLTSPVAVNNNFKITGLIEIIILALTAILSYLFWKRHYDYSDNPQLERLNALLKKRQKQSIIIIESIGDGVIVFDKNGIIDLINPPASAMTGWEVENALGHGVRDVLRYSLLKQGPDKNLPDYISDSLTGKKHVSEKVKLDPIKSQSPLIVSMSISPIVISPDNELVGGVIILHDITKEQEIEQQRSDFISTASHEMRTPIATIEAYLDLALSDKAGHLDEPLRSYVKSAHESTKHLGQLFQDLLASSQAEEGTLRNKPEAIELWSFINQLSTDFRYSTKQFNLGLEFIIGANEVIDGDSINNTDAKLVQEKYYMYIDPDRLREVISNLFSNALKYTHEGKISIGISGDKDTVQIFIKDTGLGIPAKDIPNLFQKFYSVDSSQTRSVGGTGLGLFICSKIVDMYAGKIWVDSTLDKGSTFYVTLPRISEQKYIELKHQQELKQSQRRHRPANVKPTTTTAISPA